MSEVNPNHPVTQHARENWHKICALVMDKIGASEVVITPDEIESFSRSEREPDSKCTHYCAKDRCSCMGPGCRS